MQTLSASPCKNRVKRKGWKREEQVGRKKKGGKDDNEKITKAKIKQ